MKRKWSGLPILLVGWLVAASSAQIGNAQNDKSAAVLERQLIMKQLEKDSEEFGLMVAGVKKPDQLGVRAHALAKGAREAMKSFEANVPGGTAKPEIWIDWEAFSKRMQTFVTRTEEMAKIAETGNVTAVIAVVDHALQCKQCHDIYRTKSETYR